VLINFGATLVLRYRCSVMDTVYNAQEEMVRVMGTRNEFSCLSLNVMGRDH
jgi:hypothetical protein